MKRHRVNLADIPVVLVRADQMESNPRNPYNHLTPEERYARFIQILAEVHQELMKAEKAAGMRSGSLI